MFWHKRRNYKAPWEEEWRENRCEYFTEEMMLDLGPKESLEIQKTDARGNTLGERLGGWGSNHKSMTTWRSKVHRGSYDGSRVET